MKCNSLNKILALLLFLGITACSTPSTKPLLYNHSTGLTILGLDGATWEIIDPLIAKGELPGFKTLKTSGAWGKLATIIPTESVSIWTTIATGVTPTRHGVQTFTRRIPGTDHFVPSPGTDRQVPALWNIVSDSEKSVVVAKWFASWPAETVNGAMLSPRLEAQDTEPRTYPLDLFQEIDHFRELTTMDQLPQAPMRNMLVEPIPDSAAPFTLIGQKTVKATMFDDTSVWLAAQYVYKKYLPDLYMVYLKSTDRVEHFLWGAHNVENPDDFQRAEAEAIYGWYRYYDGLIQELLKDKNRTLIVISDHGMRAQKNIPEPYYIWNIDFDQVLELLEMLVRDGRSTVWEQTQIYTYRVLPFDRQVQFRVNVVDREPQGIIKQKDMDKLVSESIIQLKKLRSREGQPLFQKVITSEKNCEIICTLSSKITLNHTLEYNNKSINLRNIVVRKGLPRGIHTDAPPGIIAIHGPGIEQGKEILGADVYDVSPTALYILGLPVAKDFDGEMLIQSFDSQYTTDNPVHTLPSYGERNHKSGLTTTKGDKRMLDELRALGYIN